MRVAISTDGEFVSAHFGRCPHFTLIDIEGDKVIKKEVVPNPGHAPGAIPQYLHQQGVEAIIAGGMGQRARQLFAQNNIKVIVGAPEQPVEELALAFIDNTLKTGDNVCDH